MKKKEKGKKSKSKFIQKATNLEFSLPIIYWFPFSKKKRKSEFEIIHGVYKCPTKKKRISFSSKGK